MAVSTAVSISEYLATGYEPDCDYVEGELVERNVGEKSHQKAQRALLFFLAGLEQSLNLFTIQEQRIQISPARYRVPDIAVMLGGEPDEEIFTTPPFLCVEILSPGDRMSRMLERVKDYLSFGVRYVWIMNPQTREAFVFTESGMAEAKDGVLRTEDPQIQVPLSEIFS